MSSPNRRLIIAANARKDIRGILLYTAQEWGSHQRNRYKSEIDATLNLIQDYPFIGAKRSDLGAEIRARPVSEQSQHVIFYLVEPRAIRILRVMHVKMDATRELQAE